jgi:DnaJ-class molecular chaperone
LYLTIEVLPHAFFRFEGDNLVCDVPIRPDEAVLGAEIKIPIQRLRQDLGVNLVGAAIVLDLAQEVAQLRAQLKVYRSGAPNTR